MHIPLSYKALRRIFLFISIIVRSSSNAQINFESGYFIDEGKVKTECLIKNQDWDENPTQFKYKLKENESVQTGSISSIQEFGVYGSFKFVRADVKMDRSPTDLADLTHSKDPIWSQEKLFLKMLLSGKANLYSYSGGKNSEKFFYSVSNKSIQQLIYKKYYISSIETNSNCTFRQQLWIDVRCDKTSKESIENLSYNKNELIKHFKKYNECFGDSNVITEIKQTREIVNISLTPGINFASATFTTYSEKYEQTVEFDDRINLRIGIEAEFILPLNKNKWSLFLEPYYKSFKGVKMIEGYDTVRVNYKALELSFGMRYYFFLNKNTKVYLNLIASPGVAINFQSTVEYDYYYRPLEISNSFNYGLGAGLNYKRLSAEVRFYSTRNLLYKGGYYACFYKEFAFILGYKLLKFNNKN